MLVSQTRGTLSAEETLETPYTYLSAWPMFYARAALALSLTHTQKTHTETHTNTFQHIATTTELSPFNVEETMNV